MKKLQLKKVYMFNRGMSEAQDVLDYALTAKIMNYSTIGRASRCPILHGRRLMSCTKGSNISKDKKDENPWLELKPTVR